MANKLLEEPIVESRKKKAVFSLRFPKLEGKFGISVYIFNKEVFLGIAVADVVKEDIIRKRFISAPKGTVRTFRFDTED